MKIRVFITTEIKRCYFDFGKQDFDLGDIEGWKSDNLEMESMYLDIVEIKKRTKTSETV